MSLDVYSYIAHGTLLATGYDPYAVSPVVLGDQPAALAADPFWRIARAPYGPLSLGLLHAVVEVTGGNVLTSVVVLRVLAVAGVAVTAVAVAGAVPAASRAWAVTVVAAGPVVLFQLVGAIHLEALMMALVALGLLAAKRGRPVIALVLLTAAASVKWPAALAAVAVVVWHASAGSGEGAEKPGVGRVSRRQRGIVLARDLTVIAATTLVSASVVPDGFGWLGAASTPSAGVTPYAPTNAMAYMLVETSAVLGDPAQFDETLRLTRAVGVVVAAAVFLWLLATIRNRDLCVTVGFALLGLAMLGPVLYPWYLVWGLVPLAMATDRRRKVLIAVPLVGTFLALPHCDLLFVNHPRVAPWIEQQAPLLLVTVGLAVATASVLARRRRPLQG
jgi:alpha-1,6-mannosyltransferase